MHRHIVGIACMLALCGGAGAATAEDPAGEALAAALAAQPEARQARYAHRHPAQTLRFFGILPGMTVVEALPGAGWYTRILLPYLGPEGRLIGADYSLEMYPLFGFMSDEQLAAKRTWVQDWREEARGWAGASGAQVSAFVFGSLPEDLKASADAVLFIRALHNLARFDAEGNFLAQALYDAFAVLKPGGLVGVVQHWAPEDRSDAWASGARGYLKKSFVIERMQAAGFELVADSDVNANPADQPGADDVVWRLAPTFAGSGDDPARRSEMAAIGESNRMTLLFRKPDPGP